MLKSVSFVPPAWASALRQPPAQKLCLGHFPTPIHSFSPPGLPKGVRMFIKRDDFSGMETSGNKIRKLEFIMADALAQKADCIVTIGGVQSNHCRATAAVARMLELDSYLLLRTNKPDEDPGLIGNVLFDRMLDANLIQMSRQEYGKYGSEAMIKRTCDRLREEGRRPYDIPVGGSSGLGTWGYVQTIDEINNQLNEHKLPITDIAFACGSGGTAAGIGVGSYLYAKAHPDAAFNYDDKIPAHAYIVCDNNEYFHSHIDGHILPAMGAPSEISSRQFLQTTNAQGTGYARSTKKELEFIYSVSRKTGVLMDPVYSGKALFHLIEELNKTPEKFVGKTILFVHTGGQFGMYDKVDSLKDIINQDKVSRFVMELQTARLTRTLANGLRFASSVSIDAAPYYDVVVVGGGVMGFSTAYHLAVEAPNLKVAVVEKDPCYKYASAILSAGGIRHQFSETENIEMSLYGTENLRNIGTNMKVDGHDAPDVQFVEGGYMFLASEEGADILKQNYVTQKAAGADVQLLDPVALKKRFPWINTEGVEQAVLGMKDQGWFDPWAFLNAMKRKSVSLGVDVLEGEAKHFDLGGQNQIEKVHIEVKHSPECRDIRFNSVRADVVVNAAGCWSSKLLEACGVFDYPVKPRKRSVFAFHCDTEEVWKGDAATPLVVDTNGVYFRREGSGGRFICGWSPEPENDNDGQSTDELDFPDHEQFEEQVWPTIAHRVKLFEAIKVLGAWAGFYDYNTLDQNAIIGLHPDVPNMYLINGFSGHGLQHSPAAGRAISELVLHGVFQTIDCSRFSFSRVRANKPFLEQGIV
ncbi:unnamed protein product [Peronospora destructor]|uniref:FAD dependent oxidoreductase domain-containing protein n=2 Tax=Peronospora destructor TaxID=86335 RepID=A0AAV0TI91_9STRA|nr:unnamed protein product [Peronospora destructor]